MTIFRFSPLIPLLLVAGCNGVGFKPRNDLESRLQGNVPDVITYLESYIAEKEDNRAALEADLLDAGFRKGEFVKKLVAFETTRLNCQFYNYRRDHGLVTKVSAVVWLCDEGSGANFGYTAP